MKCNFNEPIEEEKQEEEEDVEYNEDNSSILRNKLQNLARVLEVNSKKKDILIYSEMLVCYVWYGVDC